MKRVNILKSTANPEIMDNLRQEYLTNPDNMDGNSRKGCFTMAGCSGTTERCQVAAHFK
jgi:hypothetical protein